MTHLDIVFVNKRSTIVNAVQDVIKNFGKDGL